MDSDSVLAFEDVCFAYEETEVLHNVTLAVHPGDLVAVVGPNGGGKSTLLKLALGLLHPLLGTVRLFGAPPERGRARAGYVPQHLQFDAAFPVDALDVVLMGRAERHRFGPYRRADREAARHALERVGMTDLARRAFADLSGGERQRVLVAQALASEPELLLLDEPTANVDAGVEHRLYDLLKELTARLAVVVVSHNLSVVTRHASHVACVNRTASILPMAQLTEDALHAVVHGERAVLQHHDTCHIIDPSLALRTPHRAAEEREEAGR